MEDVNKNTERFDWTTNREVKRYQGEIAAKKADNRAKFFLLVNPNTKK